MTFSSGFDSSASNTSLKNASKNIDIILANDQKGPESSQLLISNDNNTLLESNSSNPRFLGSKLSSEYVFDSAEFEFLQPMIIPEILYEQYDRKFINS